MPVALKARVDELATQIMIEGSSHAAIAALLSISEDADREDAPAAARTANALVVRLKTSPEDGIAHLLESGIAALRASLETTDAEATNNVPASLGEDAELVSDFLVEAREHLSQIEGQMLTLERDPTAMEVIHAVFRAFHTIKGLAGFLDFKVVQAVAHEVETLLDLARNEKLTINPSIVDVVLESGDFLQGEMTAIDRALSSGAALSMGHNEALVAKIRKLAAGQDSSTPATVTAGAAPEQNSAHAANGFPTLTVKPARNTPPVSASSAPDAPFSQPPNPPAVVAAPAPPARVAAAAQDVSAAPPSPAGKSKDAAKSPDAGSVRVETAKLDHLMNMVGEIVIAQSLIRHNSMLGGNTDTRLLGDLSQLARVTAEVQRATMSMRMIPVGQLFQRIERVIRDLSRKAGKQVVLEASGTDTEIDKTVAEELSDPLLHMVRNSVDHGIELAADRLAAGKTAEAHIRLSAHHQGGQVIIQISDDGRGLNSERIRRKAEERQLISPTAQLTDSEVYQLIFEPGFSTADKITDVSGRGVGMDVVRRNVEKLRGRIDTHSTLGQGTTFLLKLPLTLAIIDGLVVEVGAERYIIPLSAVKEIFRPKAETVFSIEGRDEMVLVREHLIPVVRLHHQLAIEARHTELSKGLLVVVESEGKQFCLLVDDLLGKQEVVIKSLGELLKDIPGTSGCAVLGDGRIGLILDTDGIYRERRR